MNDIKEIINDVVRRARASGFKRRSLAKAAGLSENTLRDLKDPNKFSPSIETVHALQKTLDHIEGLNQEELRAFVKQYGIHPPKTEKENKNSETEQVHNHI